MEAITDRELAASRSLGDYPSDVGAATPAQTHALLGVPSALQRVREDSIRLTPPRGLEDVHAHWRRAIDAAVESSSLIVRGLMITQPSQLTEMQSLFDESRRLGEVSTREMKAMRGSLGHSGSSGVLTASRRTALRWFLVLPAALLGALAIGAMILVLLPMPPQYRYMINSAATGYAFVFCGAYVAPSRKRVTAYVLLALFLALSLGAAFGSFAVSTAFPLWWELLCILAGGVGAAYAGLTAE